MYDEKKIMAALLDWLFIRVSKRQYHVMLGFIMALCRLSQQKASTFLASYGITPTDEDNIQ